MLRLFPYITTSAPLTPRSGRGFTLLELLAVVILIGILAAIAIPAASSAMRERRSSRAAHEIALLFNQARARAIARGSAVLVRYNYEANGFEVREAIAGTSTTGVGSCELAPQASCTVPTTRWDNSSKENQLLSSFQPLNTSTYEMVDIELKEYTASDTTKVTKADFCMTPSGRVFYRADNASTVPFAPMAGNAGFRVWMKSSAGDVIGIERTIFVFSNGTARVAL